VKLAASPILFWCMPMVSKPELAYFIAGLMERRRVYSAEEISNLILSSVHPRFFLDPRLAPDHLRLALVENGFAARDATGATYWLSDCYFGPTDEAGLVAKTRELMGSVSEETVQCPACGKTSGTTSLLSHVRSEHGSIRWLRLMQEYGA